MEPGCKADHVLVLEGRQGLGKSTAIETIGAPWYTDEIAEVGTKDASEQVSCVWVIEFSELGSLNARDLNKIKSFLSRKVDRFRCAYGHRVQAFPRQSVFAGTINHDQYLQDETGGRRFWPIKCAAIDIDALRQNKDQLLAEAVAAYRSGELWHLDDPKIMKLAEEEQRHRIKHDSWLEPTMDIIEARRGAGIPDRITVGDLLDSLGVTTERQDQKDMNRVARCLKLLGWHRKQVWNPETKKNDWCYVPDTE